MLTCFTFLPNLASGAHYGRVHAMADYRAYLVDEDGHFSEAVPLICADDTEAIEKARPLAVNKDVELWQLDRKVAVLPSTKDRVGSIDLTKQGASRTWHWIRSPRSGC